jgi:hypothetical protein
MATLRRCKGGVSARRIVRNTEILTGDLRSISARLRHRRPDGTHEHQHRSRLRDQVGDAVNVLIAALKNFTVPILQGLKQAEADNLARMERPTMAQRDEALEKCRSLIAEADALIRDDPNYLPEEAKQIVASSFKACHDTIVADARQRGITEAAASGPWFSATRQPRLTALRVRFKVMRLCCRFENRGRLGIGGGETERRGVFGNS